ncbi:MAG: TonB-dependent receptor [Acidobacteriia bacterium]|nr:TonB-dependent receptor [Terriglobia bacterium]
MSLHSKKPACAGWQRLVLAILVALLIPASGFAQQAAGKIVGTVTDAQSGVMPGVKVTATNKATQISATSVTDKEGYYQILNLPIGDYRVTAARDGFRTLITDAPPLEINQVLRVDLRMEVGARTETVTVEGSAVSVETVNPTLGQSVTSRPAVDLPLNGRNVLDLALLQPGVTEVNPGAADGGQTGAFGIAGGKSDSVTYLLDGGINNDLLGNEVVYNPVPDAIAEFRILTSNYAAEYGRNAGGVVSVVTKSGTNDVHGSVYDFLRNEALDANSYFNNRDGVPKQVLKRNQFGVAVGGPVVIPHVVHGKDKFFWFASYSGQRQIQAINTTSLPVYTPAELQGDFSQSGTDPATGNRIPDPQVVAFLQAYPYFAGNSAQGIIDPTKFSPVATNYIQANLIPTSATGTKIAQAGSKNDSDQLSIKLDAQLSSEDKLSATMGWSRNPVLNPFSFAFGSLPADAYGYGSIGDHHREFLNLAWSRSFSATLLNEARFTAQRINIAQAIPATSLPTPSQLGIGITPDQSTGPTIIGFYRGLTLGFSPQGPTTEINNTFGISDTLTWVKSKHTTKFGFLFSPYQNNTHYDFYVNGEFDFYDSATSVGSGNSFADFLMGLPDEYYQFGAAPSNIRSRSYYAFAQDEWHLRKNFTITYGLRYEYNSPKFDTQGRSFSMVPGQQSTRFANAPVGLLFPGDAGAPKGANFPDRNNFAPRFGFAWDPFNDGKTSIRGGFGVFYDILKGEDNLQFNGQAPFFGFVDMYFPSLAGNPTSDPGYLTQPFVAADATNPFPSKPPAANIDFGATGFLPFGGGGVYFVDPHLRTPYTYQFNFGIERDLTRGLVLETNYVGSATHKQTALVDQNPYILGTDTRLLNTQPGTLPDGSNGFSYLLTFGNIVNSNYNSLEASLTKHLADNRWLGHSYFTLAYTWGKSIDDASGFRNVNDRVPYYNHDLFRAVSDYDIAHRIAFSGGWDLPFDQLWGSGPKRLTKGWSLYPIVTWRTGFPMDISAQIPTTRTDPGPSGAGDASLVRANLTTSNVPIFDPHQTNTFNGATGSFWFDPTGFNTDYDPAVLTYGTYPRNRLRGPHRANFDFAVAKKTALAGERLNLEFRAEFFNMLNQAEFQLPTLNITDPSFGQISSTYDPRIIQFALKLTF